jgi:uncharacterized protein (TIGR02569 family)
MTRHPIHTVAELFGASRRPVLLAGGRGGTWRAGEVIIKPSADDTEATELADLVERVAPPAGIRIPRPVRSARGTWVEAGFVAWTFLEGAEASGRYRDKLRACDDFTAAFATVAQPRFVTERTNPWAVADRVTWGELDVAYPDPFGSLFSEVQQRLRPINLPSQVIHGDIAGNIVFAAALPPGVIVLTLYWRPAALAKALLIADAVAWEGARPELYECFRPAPEAEQLMLRAALRRMIEQAEQARMHGKDKAAVAECAARYLATLRTIGLVA